MPKPIARRAAQVSAKVPANLARGSLSLQGFVDHERVVTLVIGELWASGPSLLPWPRCAARFKNAMKTALDEVLPTRKMPGLAAVKLSLR